MLTEPTYLSMRIVFLYNTRSNIYFCEMEKAEAPAIRYSTNNRCCKNRRISLIQQDQTARTCGTLAIQYWAKTANMIFGTRITQTPSRAEKMAQYIHSDTMLLELLWFYFIWLSRYFPHQTSVLSSLPLLMYSRWYSVDMGALTVKLDTEQLLNILKSFPGITGWSAYNADLMAKAATAFCLFFSDAYQRRELESTYSGW